MQTYVGSRDPCATAWAAAEWQPYSGVKKSDCERDCSAAGVRFALNNSTSSRGRAWSEGQGRTEAVKRSRANGEGVFSSREVLGKRRWVKYVVTAWWGDGCSVPRGTGRRMLNLNPGSKKEGHRE